MSALLLRMPLWARTHGVARLSSTLLGVMVWMMWEQVLSPSRQGDHQQVKLVALVQMWEQALRVLG